MSELHDLSDDEREVLQAALREPIFDRDPTMMRLCLNLCGRRLLQRAGGVAVANGWGGTPHAFVLTREGWRLLGAGRRRAVVRRAS